MKKKGRIRSYLYRFNDSRLAMRSPKEREKKNDASGVAEASANPQGNLTPCLLLERKREKEALNLYFSNIDKMKKLKECREAKRLQVWWWAPPQLKSKSRNRAWSHELFCPCPEFFSLHLPFFFFFFFFFFFCLPFSPFSGSALSERTAPPKSRLSRLFTSQDPPLKHTHTTHL